MSIERKFLKLKFIKSYCVKERLSEFVRLWLGKKIISGIFFFGEELVELEYKNLINNLINI